MKQKVTWKVDGMDCTNCALTIRKYLEKQGMQDVRVNFGTGDVSFDANGNEVSEKLSKGIHDLGYKVMSNGHAHDHGEGSDSGFLSTHFQKFLFCLPFTLVLMLHMFPDRKSVV